MYFKDAISHANASPPSRIVVGTGAKEDSGVTTKVDLKNSYQQSRQCRTTGQKLSAIMIDLVARERNTRRTVSNPVSYPTSVIWQVSH